MGGQFGLGGWSWQRWVVFRLTTENTSATGRVKVSFTRAQTLPCDVCEVVTPEPTLTFAAL